VPADAPEGLCPNCVLKAGLQTGGGSQVGSATTDGHSWPDSFVPPTPAELAPLFPELEILELLGRGGMGVVYKARQKRLDRFVALKILSPQIGQDPAFATRFLREARSMAMLNHPHIVAVYDFGQTASPLLSGEGPKKAEGGGGKAAKSPILPGQDQGEGIPNLLSPSGTAAGGEGVPNLPSPSGTVAGGEGIPNLPSPSGRGAGGEGSLYYFFMEFVDGVNVRRLLEAGKLVPSEALAIVPQICEALQYAHDHGVVHRDIKPENVLLDKEGRVKIADFGIAKLVGRDAKDLTLTGAGQIVGTPQYMAPEQIEHPLQVDHRADIYSLGVVFYQMLTGELPIGRFAAPSKKVQIDVRLDEVVLRALEKEPDLRYQHASEVKSEVETIAAAPVQRSAKESAVAPPASVPPPPQFADVVAMVGRITFTSPLARSLANASALGFLGALAFLGFIPLPGMQHCFGFSGFTGFFGLIGIAAMVEHAHRRKNESAAKGADEAGKLQPGQDVVPRISAYAVRGAVWAALAVSYAIVRIVLGPPRQMQSASEGLFLILSLAALPGVPILGALALGEIRRSNGMVRGVGLAIFNLLFTPLLLLNAVIGFELCWTWESIVAMLKVDQLNRVSFLIPTLLLSAILDFPLARWAYRAVNRQAHRGCGNHFTKGERIALLAAVLATVLLCAITFAVVAEPVRKTSQGPAGPHQSSASAEPTEKWLAGRRDYDVAALEAKGDSLSAARANFEYAEAIHDVVKAKREAGAATEKDYLVAERDRDLAAAEMKGDKQALARLRLAYAEKLLDVVDGQRKAGAAPEAEYAKAKVAREMAATDLQKLEDERQSVLITEEMRTVILAGLEYATEHSEWPTALDDLKPKYLDANKIDLSRFIYFPVSKESLEKNPQEVVVLGVKKPTFTNGQPVGFADGYVEFIQDPERLQRVPAEAEPRPASPERKKEVK